jgi:hypothetical protein
VSTKPLFLSGNIKNMKNSIFSARFFFVSAAIIAAASTRFLHFPPNFSVVGSLALFAGACMPKRWQSLLIPMVTMLITDAVLGFHNTMWAVYSAFALTTVIGWYISEKQSVFNILSAVVLSTGIFFIITNAAMWVVGYYNSLSLALVEGIPFYGNTLVSQLLFSTILFGAYHLARVNKPALVRA